MEKKTKPGAIQQLLDYAGDNKKQLYFSTFLATLGELFGMTPFIAVSLLVSGLFNKTATIQNVLILFVVALGGHVLKLWLTYGGLLEAVLVLQKQKGYARCVDVSEFLGVTKPSVSRAVKELSKKKCLLKKDDGTLSLTEQGQSIAKQIYEKHRFFTKQLIKAGVPCDIAEADACRLEHVISETSFARLKEAATQEQK